MSKRTCSQCRHWRADPKNSFTLREHDGEDGRTVEEMEANADAWDGDPGSVGTCFRFPPTVYLVPVRANNIQAPGPPKVGRHSVWPPTAAGSPACGEFEPRPQ